MARIFSFLLFTTLLSACAAPDLQQLIYEGDTARLAAELEAGANPDGDQPSWDGNYPLHYAIAVDDIEAVQLLLRAGANPEKLDKFGNPPLTTAVRVNNAEATRLLLRAGANPDDRHDVVGRKPLHVAAAKPGNNSAGVIRALLVGGADPDSKDNYGNRPLHQAFSAEYVNLLVDGGADVNARADNGTTPLHQASKLEVMRALLANGADRSLKTRSGLTPEDVYKLRAKNAGVPEAEISQRPEVALMQGKRPPRREKQPLVAAAPAPKPGLKKLLIPDNSGQYLSPYTSDGVVAEWVNKAINAKMGSAAGSAVGAAAGAYAGQKLMENVPGGNLLGGIFGGMAGSKAGQTVGRDTAIAASGGWDHIRASSDQSFRSLEDMARYISATYAGTAHYQDAIKAADAVYPGLLKAVASSQ